MYNHMYLLPSTWNSLILGYVIVLLSMGESDNKESIGESNLTYNVYFQR